MAHDAEPTGEIVLYRTKDGRTRLECRFVDETLWLSQALMAELFQISVPTVNEHLKGIYADGELDSGATIREFRMVRREGTRQVAREIEHYSLDAILAVGYRVRSPRGTQFRIWATERLSEYLVKGFTMDDGRLSASVRRPIRFAMFWKKEKQNARDHCDRPGCPLAAGFCQLIHHGRIHSCPLGHRGRGDTDSRHSRSTRVTLLVWFYSAGQWAERSGCWRPRT